jgi:hypothetical protein
MGLSRYSSELGHLSVKKGIAMREDKFIDLVLENLFVRGFNCPNLPLLSMYVTREYEQCGESPDLNSFLPKCFALPGVTHRPESPTGETPSPTAGARDRWLAAHEAGHAIVGIKAGFTLRGVRFYGAQGFPGETGFPDEDWERSADEDLLRRLIRVDVAGNIAEMVRPANREPEGRLSALYDDLTPGKRPSDFCSADARAECLAVVLYEKARKPTMGNMMWDVRRSILEQAESEAEEVLRKHRGALARLADCLQRGPMSGTEVLGILNS